MAVTRKKGTEENALTPNKVYVFTAPLFESDADSMQNQEKRNHHKWKFTHFDVNVDPVTVTLKRSKTLNASASDISSDFTESTEEISELNLHQEFEVIRNSVISYLENTFSDHSQQFSQVVNMTNYESDPILTKQSAQQEYAFSLDQSQKLFDKMQGFVEMSMVQLTKPESEYNTKNFNETESLESSSKSVDSNENLCMQPSHFTKLSNCTQHFSTVNIFVVVLQVNPMKEIKVKASKNYGQFVTVSSILVGDPTKEYFKITFWQKAAQWVNNLNEGDIIVVKKLKVEKWKEEFYGQSTNGTRLVILQKDGTNSYRLPAHWLTMVSHSEGASLLKWVKCKHSYLMSNKTSLYQDVQWSTLTKFVPNTLVHYVAKIVKILTYSNTKGKYEYAKCQVNKIVAVAVDPETAEEVPICLWGSQAVWQYEFKSKIGQTWEFKFLRVVCNSLHGQQCLHTTPHSTKTQANLTSPPKPTFSSILELLNANLNGNATIAGGVTAVMHLESERKIDQTSDLPIVHNFFRKLVYLGCKLCFRALKQDENGIYTHCSYCIEHSSSYMFGIMYCWRPCLLYLSKQSVTIIAKSCHESMCKLLKDVKPQDILEEGNTTLFERLKIVFNTVNKNITIVLNCETLLDENGFVKSQNFEFLDLHV